MRILMLVHAFNSLSQRLYVELGLDGHEISVELDIHDRVTCEAVDLWNPDVILAPFLKRAIPSALWQRYLCLIVHPGPPGDRGPSALDWAILRGEKIWGVTVLQAQAEFDAGPVWGSAAFPMRCARKSSLYRNEVTEGAISAVRAALARVAQGAGPLPDAARGHAQGWQPALRQHERAIDWTRDDTATVLRKIHSADGFPGLDDLLFGRRFKLFDAHAEMHLTGQAGAIIARRHEAICRATADGAVWIGQLQPMEGRAWLQASRGVCLGRFRELPGREHCRLRRYPLRGAAAPLVICTLIFTTAHCPRPNAIDCAAPMHEPASGPRESSC